jgi:mannan endo-1,4-beta-mannosidase
MQKRLFKMKKIFLSLIALVLFQASYSQIKVEAETGLLTGTVVENIQPGFSGSGYVTGFDNGNDAVTMNITVDSGGIYNLSLGFLGRYGEKVNDIYVNDVYSGSFGFPGKPEFSENLFGKINLNAGLNTIKLVKNWGWIDLDYITVVKAAPSDISRINKSLVVKFPTERTKTLYRYLGDMYGKKIISGQQADKGKEVEFNYIEKLTGKTPAIKGFDMIEYSPSRLAHGSSSAEVEEMIKWWGRGGIVTCCWHWNAPFNLKDTVGNEWWSGFYTRATTFDPTIAMKDDKSKEYKAIIHDMDVIAGQLRVLRDANVPVLWRPFHEAEGKWFWWGAYGPETCKWLYRLMFDRFTKYHSLDNLIWVWTEQDTPTHLDWYPGDAYVDIVSADIYLADRNYSPSFKLYDKLCVAHECKKIVTMSENGVIPDMDWLVKDGAKWSWFCTWTDHIKNVKVNEAEHIKKVYNHTHVITLDELPDFDTYTGPK